MRIDEAGARTWLLAAAAGWAVIGWGLALAGMGGRVEPLADDPSLLRPLPTMPAASVAQLGPPSQYSEIGARPLFDAERQPRPFVLQGEVGESAAAAFDYVLTSVLLTPRLKLAILQPADGSESVRVRLDEAPESHPAWRLIALGTRSAVFEGPEGQREMQLRVFDGLSGQPPTAVSSAQPPAIPVGVPVAPPPRVRVPEAAEPANGAALEPEPVLAPETAEMPMTDQSQMEAIRQRIQARRAQLRQNPQNPPSQPPAKSP